MTVLFNATAAAVRQTADWTCSAAALAWVLQSVGVAANQDDVVARLGPNRIDPSIGLHDASGAGLADVARSYGLEAGNGAVDYDQVLGMAGSVPLAIGGINFYHWTGVRGRADDDLLLANPAPGYDGIYDRMSRAQFAQLGPFYGVWIVGSASSSQEAPPPRASGSLWPLLLGAGVLAWALDLI